MLKMFKTNMTGAVGSASAIAAFVASHTSLELWQQFVLVLVNAVALIALGAYEKGNNQQ